MKYFTYFHYEIICSVGLIHSSVCIYVFNYTEGLKLYKTTKFLYVDHCDMINRLLIECGTNTSRDKKVSPKNYYLYTIYNI